MQGVEDTTRYDPSTGRGVWTEAYEALEAALNDSAADMSMLADDGTVQNNPLTVDPQRHQEKGMHLPNHPRNRRIGIDIRPRRLRRRNRHRHVLR